jgi:NADH:ubiquinone oxidoreductase subunit K
MPSSLFLLLAGILIAIALIAAFKRTQVILTMASLNMAASASVLLLAVIGTENQNAYALWHAFIVICMSALINLVFCGVVILVFRSRGTLRLDDYRELRG